MSIKMSQCPYNSGQFQLRTPLLFLMKMVNSRNALITRDSFNLSVLFWLIIWRVCRNALTTRDSFNGRWNRNIRNWGQVAMPLQLGTVSTPVAYNLRKISRDIVAMPLQLGTVSTFSSKQVWPWCSWCRNALITRDSFNRIQWRILQRKGIQVAMPS